MSARARNRVLQGLVLVVGLSASAWFFWGKPAPQPTVEKPPVAPLVDVVTVQPASFELMVQTQGSIEPRREIDLIAQVAGKVEMVADSFAEGGFFEAGQVLVQLEQQDYRFATQRARAQLADARQLLAMEKGRVRQARREWRDLGDSDANDLFLRKPQLASAEAALVAAEADLAQAELSLQRTTISAPFDGRILEKFADQGQYLTPGALVAKIYSTDAVEVSLPLSDRQLELLDIFAPSTEQGPRKLDIPVQLEGRIAGRDWRWQGTITRTNASIDPRSRVMYAVAEIRDPFEPDAETGRPPLMIGQFVRAEITGRVQEDAVVLPRRALRPQNRIWLLDQDDRIQIVPVQRLQSDSQQVVVQGEIPAGSRIVVSAVNIVTPGMQVIPQQVSPGGGE